MCWRGGIPGAFERARLILAVRLGPDELLPS